MIKTPKQLQYFFLLFAVGFACFVLFISLQSANKSYTATDSFKEKKFYIHKEILPDHILYPWLMFYDRFRLELADQEEKNTLYVAYAKRRIFYAKRLLEKGETSLALTTYSKAIKYLNQALINNQKLLGRHNSLQSRYDQQEAFLAIESSNEAIESINQERDKFADSDLVILDNLIAETVFLRDVLQEKLLNQ